MATDTRLLQIRGGVTFIDCLQAAIHSEMVSQWERLSGKKLVPASPLDRMIDEATGYDMVVIREFADFVYWYVFLTMPVEG
jgi:hypothetical protein